jgi:hypothetical protein
VVLSRILNSPALESLRHRQEEMSQSSGIHACLPMVGVAFL